MVETTWSIAGGDSPSNDHMLLSDATVTPGSPGWSAGTVEALKGRAGRKVIGAPSPSFLRALGHAANLKR